MKLFLTICTVVATSLFYFPFEFTFLLGVNTKLMLAGVGLVLIGYHMVVLKGIYLSKEIFGASLIAIVFSLFGCFSVDYNHTTDYAYATYIVSMWIWLAASYSVVLLIANVHGYLSVRLVVNYLIAVCVLQCFLALLIEFNPATKALVDQYISLGITDFLNEVNRLYGIGATLDVAGVRFSAILIMIAVLMAKDEQVRKNKGYLMLYTVSFFVVAIVGNMISRSTSVGMIIGVLYFILATGALKFKMQLQHLRVWQIVIGGAFTLVLLTIYFYNTNKEVYELLRYGFEGFFKWVETGRWETSSTNKLQSMWVYPDNLKTWLIGDAYFEDPTNPKYFYMRTDIGYLRFIFYCGLLGLATFCLFFIYLTVNLWHKFPYVKHLFGLLLLLVFFNWVKVSTDIFLVYAVFLSLGSPYLYNRYYRKASKP